MTLKEEMQKKRDEKSIGKDIINKVVKSVKEFFLKLQEKDIKRKNYVAALDIEEYVEIRVRKADEDVKGDFILKLEDDIPKDKLKKFIGELICELEKEGISCDYSNGITIIMSITLN